jgi:CTP:molybdopterin cytidylyltransferase MocA
VSHGLLLAAGAGSRMGRPKALVDGWLEHGVTTLLDGGCDAVTVVLGAAVDDALALLPVGPVDHVVAEDWAEGMSASLRVGLAALADRDVEAAVVLLVDLPDVGAPVVGRLLAAGSPAGSPSSALARAAYDGRPGHPVLLGRDHWDGVLATARGDEGARAYLAAHEVALVECGDLATGQDVDRPFA